MLILFFHFDHLGNLIAHKDVIKHFFLLSSQIALNLFLLFSAIFSYNYFYCVNKASLKLFMSQTPIVLHLIFITNSTKVYDKLLISCPSPYKKKSLNCLQRIFHFSFLFIFFSCYFSK